MEAEYLRPAVSYVGLPLGLLPLVLKWNSLQALVGYRGS